MTVGYISKDKLKAYKLFFGTLTSKDRLLIINALRNRVKTVNELQKELRLEQTRVSHNLRRLRNCGFVKVAQQGKYRAYSLNKSTIRPLMDMIDKHMEDFCIRIVSHRNKKEFILKK